MKKIIYSILLFSLFSIGEIAAQKIKRDVVGAAGGASTFLSGSTTIRLSCTVGQPPNAGTDANATIYLRQGFEQPPKKSCAAAPISDFVYDELSSGDCGVKFNLTYTGVPEDSTQYLWEFGPNASPTTSNEQNPQNVTFNSIGTQTITLTVVTEGCSHISSQDIQVSVATDLAVDIADQTDVLCSENSDGSASIDIQGGTTPYQVNWSNGAVGEQVTDLAIGTYEFTVTDGLGCQIVNNVIIEGNDSISVVPDIVDESCTGTEDGLINLEVMGGLAPYQYLWSNGSSFEDLTNLTGDTYTVTISDANNCIKIIANLEVKIGCLDFDFRNLFTPNGDGSNETWNIPGIENFPDNRLEIYNRWGTLVFDMDGYDNSWIGQNNSDGALPAGPYYYILYLNDTDDTTFNGAVTILR